MKQTIKATSNKCTKDLSLEVMRIIAAYFVIFNHTGKMGFLLFTQYQPGSFRYWLYMPLSIFCKFSVPVFFMISGALLLGKDEPIKTILKKRVFRVFVTLFAFSIIYFVRNIIIGFIPYSPLDNIISFFISFCSGKVNELLWFLYSYTVFLLLLPLLRNVVKKIGNREYVYLFILSFVFMVITPFCNSFLFDNQNMFPDFQLLTTINIVYPLFGYYLYNVVDVSKSTRQQLCIIWAINLFLIVLSCLLTYIRYKEYSYSAESIFKMFTMFNSFAIFVTIRKLIPKHSNKPKTIIYSMGICTFGIYLFHPFALTNSFENSLQKYLLSFVHDPMISVLIFCIIVFLACYLITFILKQIPVVKKFI